MTWSMQIADLETSSGYPQQEQEQQAELVT